MYGVQGYRSKHEKVQEVWTGILCGMRTERETALSEDTRKKYLPDVWST